MGRKKKVPEPTAEPIQKPTKQPKRPKKVKNEQNEQEKANTKKPVVKEKPKKPEKIQKREISDESSSSLSSSDSDKKDSDSGSDSDSDSSEPEPQVKSEPINSVTNLSPVKRYEPPGSQKSSSDDSYHSDTEEEDKKRRKKQKKQIQMQLTKRMKRTSTSRNDMEDDLFDQDIKQELDDENDNPQSNNDEIPDWPEADYLELFKRMQSQLPIKDNQKFDSRAAKLDWEQIAFQDYTPRDCCDMWIRISKRIRRFRLLGEMLHDAKQWVSKPWTNFYRGSKKNRHPDMPARPLSTYMIYYLEHKDRVAKENPGMEMTQVSKIISEMYKSLDASERDKYAVKAAKERQDFGEKLNEFYKEHPEMVANTHAQKLTARDGSHKGPKRPCTPFKLFVQEQLKMYASDPVNSDKKQVEEKAKEKWKNMSDKKKLTWIDWSLQDAKRYDEELRVFRLEHPDYVAPHSGKSILNKDERIIKERLAGKPVKPPNSAYSLFSRIMLQGDKDVKSIPPKLRMAEISRKWKAISDSQKHRYEETVRELQDQYKLAFASYLETLPQDERAEELQKNLPKRKNAARSVERLLKKRVNHKSSSERSVTAALAKTQQQNNSKSENEGLNLYKGEPAPPPVRAYDLFLKTFMSEKPAGTSEQVRLQEAPKYWEILAESSKETYRKKLEEMKQKYIHNYEVFLKGLSPDELKEFSVMKAKAKKMEEAQEQMVSINGRLSDSNDSDSNDSSSGSDSDDSDSGKSSKSTSSDNSDTDN